LNRFSQGTLRENRIARQQFPSRIHREKVSEMLLQATRFIRFIALNIPTGKMQFDLLGKHVEHEKGSAVGIFHFFSGFAIDGSDDHGACKKSVDEFGECFLKVVERKVFEKSSEWKIAGRTPLFFPVPQPEEGKEGFPMVFRPSGECGGIGTIGDESEKSEREEGSEGI
jgi:hypothetical protein